MRLTGKLVSMTDWHEQCQMKMKHVWVSDCMSLVEHLNAEVPKKVFRIRRLGIELAALRQSLWTGNGQKSSPRSLLALWGTSLFGLRRARMLADASDEVNETSWIYWTKLYILAVIHIASDICMIDVWPDATSRNSPLGNLYRPCLPELPRKDM